MAALQKMLNLAQSAGLMTNSEQKGTSTTGNLGIFNQEIAKITKSNDIDTFLIYINIDSISSSKSNEKYSKIINSQLFNNVLSSIKAVINGEFSKYNLSIYEINESKIGIIAKDIKSVSNEDLKTDDDDNNNNKQATIKIIREIATGIQSMIYGSCGQQQSISIGITLRKDNENQDTFTSRCDLLLKKSKDNNSSIAYDTEYFGFGGNNTYNDTAFSVGGNEIITICVGGSGTNIGKEYFNLIMSEHKLDQKSGKFTGNMNNETDTIALDKVNTYFNCNKKQEIYTPRAVFIDIDQDNINNIKSSFLGNLIDDASFIGPKGDVKVKKFWPQGHYTDGKEIFDTIKDQIRNVVELTDCPQGFNFIHSTIGGTGGGLTSLLQPTLKDNYPDRIFANFSVYPDGKKKQCKTDEDVLQIYNSVLSLNSIKNSSNLIFPIDNVCILNILKSKLKMDEPSFSDYNSLIASVLAGVTSNIRFYGEPEILSNLNKMYMSFGIFAGPVHLSVAHSPFINYKGKNDELSTSQIYEELLNKTNNVSMNNIDFTISGKILQHQTIYKSNNQKIISDFDKKLRSTNGRLADQTTVINPAPIQLSLIYQQCQYYDKYAPLIATSIIHSTAIGILYKNLKSVFKKNFNEKKMLSSFYDQGMDSYEFIEADKNIDELVTKYKQFEDKQFNEQDDDEDEEDEEEDDDY